MICQLLGHQQATYPREAVGVIMDDLTVHPFWNLSRRRDRFYSLPFSLLRYGWATLRHGRGISYIYHSHIRDTYPSETDKAFMAALAQRWPHVGHLIFTSAGEYQVWETV